MLGIPKTIQAAQAYRYGTWAGQPNGKAFDPKLCAYEVQRFGFGECLFHQCGAKPGKGPGGLFCGTHANKIARDEVARIGTQKSE